MILPTTMPIYSKMDIPIYHTIIEAYFFILAFVLFLFPLLIFLDSFAKKRLVEEQLAIIKVFEQNDLSQEDKQMLTERLLVLDMNIIFLQKHSTFARWLLLLRTEVFTLIKQGEKIKIKELIKGIFFVWIATAIFMFFFLLLCSLIYFVTLQ